MIVNWTAPALDALDGIYEYIGQDAPLYAQHFVQQLMAAVDRLDDQPLSGRVVPEAECEDIREVICQGYRILYWVVSQTQIDIIAVVNGRQDLGRIGTLPGEAH